MLRIRFQVNETKPRARSAFAALAAEAVRHGLALAEGNAAADVVIALGGDGTILRAVRRFPDVPVLGFNLGGLGYLSAVGESEFGRALEMLAAGRYRISERSMLAVRKSGSDSPRATALNDVVVQRAMSGHSSRFDLAVDGSLAARYMADGLIFATPTGSTAYSLAAGGPVVMPDSRSFVVTPMNPHALGVRPMVTTDAVRFTVTACSRADGSAERVGVYADGEDVFTLDVGGSLEIERAPRGAALVELDGYDPYEVLARKLGWSGTSVKQP